MSDVEQSNLVAGHPPALKVGGMRVSQPNRPHGNEPEHNEPTEKHQEEEKTTSTSQSLKPTQQNIGQLISGAHVSVKDAFPEEAVRSFHEKPEPSRNKESHTKPSKISKCYQFQPRGFNSFNLKS